MKSYSRAVLFMLCLFHSWFFLNLYADEVGIPYRVVFVGVDNPAITSLLEESSKLIRLKNKHPASLGILKQRALGDIPEWTKILQALGYYEAEVSPNIDPTPPMATVYIDVWLGAQYLLDRFSIEPSAASKQGGETPPIFQEVSAQSLNIKTGEIALATQILDAQAHLVDFFESRGYPYVAIAESKIIADQRQKTLSVTLVVDTGPLMHFGPISLSGFKSVKKKFIERRVAWKEGAVFDDTLVTKTKTQLLDTGMFGIVYISHPVEPPDGTLLPMKIEVAENKPRTMNVGVSYSTHEQLGGFSSWEHRNLFGQGESVKLAGKVAENYEHIEVVYKKPGFIRINQDITWILETERQKTISYSERTLALSGIVSRKYSENLNYSIGASLERLFNTSPDNNSNYTLFSLPFNLQWSSANQFLNPTRGYSLAFSLQPYQSLSDEPMVTFVKNRLTLAGYRPLIAMGKKHRLILGAWTSVGTMLGSKKANIPGAIRFYGGSSRFMRGYTYQTVSPLNGSGQPIGGSSLLMGGGELRFEVTEKIILVSFYELGNVYSSILPQLDHKYLRSWGSGVRYLTPVGLIRGDIAFPLDKRRGLDNAYQIYISVGNSF